MEGTTGLLSAFQAWRKRPAVRLGITLAAVVMSALVQTYAIQVFVRPDLPDLACWWSSWEP